MVWCNEMARPRGLNINFNDLLAARLLADEDEMTAPELARKIGLRDGYGLIDRLERAGWIDRCRLNFGPSHFCLSRRGHRILEATLVLINRAERIST